MRELLNLRAARVRWCIEHDSGPWLTPDGMMCRAANQMIQAGDWPTQCQFELARLVLDVEAVA